MVPISVYIRGKVTLCACDSGEVNSVAGLCVDMCTMLKGMVLRWWCCHNVSLAPVGNNLLVKPVTEAGVTSVTVYFPGPANVSQLQVTPLCCAPGRTRCAVR